MRYLIILLSFPLLTNLCAQENDARFKPHLAAFSVLDIEKSTVWYESLGFILDTVVTYPDNGLKIGNLGLRDFQIELVQFDERIKIAFEDLPNEYSNINGFIKFGFLVHDLNKLVKTLESKGVNAIAGPADLPRLKSKHPWPERFYLVKDPDGNYIQFFEASGVFDSLYAFEENQGIRPFLTMISVKNFNKSLLWYEDIGFREIERVEDPGNQRALLSNGEFVIELGSFRDDVDLDDLLPKEKHKKVIRMAKIGFKSSGADSLYRVLKKSDKPFYYENVNQGKLTFIVLDPERNLVQFSKD